MQGVLAGLVCGLVLAIIVLVVNFLNVPPHWLIIGFFAGMFSTRPACKCKEAANG